MLLLFQTKHKVSYKYCGTCKKYLLKKSFKAHVKTHSSAATVAAAHLTSADSESETEVEKETTAEAAATPTKTNGNNKKKEPAVVVDLESAAAVDDKSNSSVKKVPVQDEITKD